MSGCLPSRKTTPSENNWLHESMKNETDKEDLIFGNYTRSLWDVFKTYDSGQDKLPITCLRKAFGDLGLYPANSQILEMVHCAVEYGSPCEENHITFGEFCILVDEQQHHYKIGPSLPPPQSIIKSRVETHEARKRRKESLTNFQVFLGGSCNPTTWRKDVAIPHLKKHANTFYNPQVNTWRPELIELEDKAKQAADLLFFVIDNQTRAVVSMLEVAYLVGCHRHIVVVSVNYSMTKIEFRGDSVSEREKGDLERARNILIDIVERNGIPIFSDLEQALNCSSKILQQGMKVQDLNSSHGAHPVKYGHTQVGEALLRLRETFNSITCCASGRIAKEDVKLGYRCFSGQDMDVQWLNDQRPRKNSFSFEEFCCIVTEYKKRKPSLLFTIVSKLFSPVYWIIDKFRSAGQSSGDLDIRDIYLGGSCGEDNWRADVAIPLLKRNGMSFLNPHVTEWSARLIPMQVAMREKCRLMLYAFTENTRAFAAMVEAGYYIGLGCQVVLCIVKLVRGTVIAGEELTENALNDYNRGRLYLSDMANREGIPVFDNITDAVTSAVLLLRNSA